MPNKLTMVAILLLFVSGLIASLTSAFSASETCLESEIVLLADASDSMTDEEMTLQRQGYAAAFRHPDVIDAITGSYCGGIAVKMVEFSSRSVPITEWTIIRSADDGERFARQIEAAPPTNETVRLTGILRALESAHQELLGNGIMALKQVIDISADGGENTVASCDQRLSLLENMRDKITIPNEKNGYVETLINVLPIKTETSDPPYGTCEYELPEYMDKFIRGGAGSFMEQAETMSDLPRALRKKLVIESVRLQGGHAGTRG